MISCVFVLRQFNVISSPTLLPHHWSQYNREAINAASQTTDPGTDWFHTTHRGNDRAASSISEIATLDCPHPTCYERNTGVINNHSEGNMSVRQNYIDSRRKCFMIYTKWSALTTRYFSRFYKHKLYKNTKKKNIQKHWLVIAHKKMRYFCFTSKLLRSSALEFFPLRFTLRLLRGFWKPLRCLT